MTFPVSFPRKLPQRQTESDHDIPQVDEEWLPSGHWVGLSPSSAQATPPTSQTELSQPTVAVRLRGEVYRYSTHMFCLPTVCKTPPFGHVANAMRFH